MANTLSSTANSPVKVLPTRGARVAIQSLIHDTSNSLSLRRNRDTPELEIPFQRFTEGLGGWSRTYNKTPSLYKGLCGGVDNRTSTKEGIRLKCIGQMYLKGYHRDEIHGETLSAKEGQLRW